MRERPNRRAREHIEDVARLAARGLILAEIERQTPLTLRQVQARVETMRIDVASLTGDNVWRSAADRTLVEVAQKWLALQARR